jgi:cysteinyl-tRNA synthetase
MPVRFYNTYSRQLEEFRPLDPAGKEVNLYTCGPTVYNYAHIGNYRAYVFEDLLQRLQGASRDEPDGRGRQNHSRLPAARGAAR